MLCVVDGTLRHFFFYHSKREDPHFFLSLIENTGKKCKCHKRRRGEERGGGGGGVCGGGGDKRGVCGAGRNLRTKKKTTFLIGIFSSLETKKTNPYSAGCVARLLGYTHTHSMDGFGTSAVSSPWVAVPHQTGSQERSHISQYSSQAPTPSGIAVQGAQHTAPVPPLPESKEVPLSAIPPYLELDKRAIHPGMSSEWDDPRAGIDLDVAVRSRTARRAAYESRNPPSIVRHLAQAFVGKNSAYTESTQYVVGPGGARNLVDASMFTDSSGFLTDYDAARPKTAGDAKDRSEVVGTAEEQKGEASSLENLESNLAYPRDLRPAGPFCAYRPRGIRSTRISVQEDGKRGWQHQPRHHRK